MNRLDKYKHTLFISASILSCIFFLTKCINNENEKKQILAEKKAVQHNITYEQFAGSGSCAHCHKNISEDYLHTGHYLTSSIASEKTVKGSFAQGKNSF